MALNEFNSKVTLKTGEVLIDLTQDDVKPEHVKSGIMFHDKTGKRQPGTNTFTVDASNVTADPEFVLDGLTFGKGNTVVSGTMPNNTETPIYVSSKTGTPLPRGYVDGSTSAMLDPTEASKLTPQNIKQGVTLFGVDGEFGADDIASQSKTVTPTFETQIIEPDPEYTFLSTVQVNAIPVERTDNEAGGVTVTIG